MPLSPELLELVARSPELPDSQVWQLAVGLGIRCDMEEIGRARRTVCEGAMQEIVEELQEDLWARVTFSEHLRGVKLVSAGKVVTIRAGEEVPAVHTGGQATSEAGPNRLLVSLPLYVQARRWGNAYLLMDRSVLSRTTQELTRTLNWGAVILSALLVLLLLLWGLWSVWLLRRLRLEVISPVVALARRMETWAQEAPSQRPHGGEPQQLHEAFDRLLERVREQSEQLLRAQRLGLMERIGASLSHELNNALNPASLRLEELILEGQPASREDVETLREYLRSAQQILKDISSSARRSEAPKRTVAPAEWLFVAKRLVEPQFQNGPALVWRVEEHAPVVYGEEPALIQVAVNLLLNAREAVEQAGSEGWVRVVFGEAGGLPRLLVEDNGPGLSFEVAGNLFEPFVTTKAQGTGLGLFVVDTLVRRMGGSVRLFSREGGGATAEVLLPPAPSEGEALAER
jgi:C4-dicarboxylate-specific signal transduction histidine kinase